MKKTEKILCIQIADVSSTRRNCIQENSKTKFHAERHSGRSAACLFFSRYSHFSAGGGTWGGGVGNFYSPLEVNRVDDSLTFRTKNYLAYENLLIRLTSSCVVWSETDSKI